jgi:hypothetical protein
MTIGATSLACDETILSFAEVGDGNETKRTTKRKKPEYIDVSLPDRAGSWPRSAYRVKCPFAQRTCGSVC